MDRDAQLKRLADPSIGFCSKLKLSIALELDFWDRRLDPPNLTRGMFLKLIDYVPEDVHVRWVPRTSSNGPHGRNGEDSVFKFSFTATLMGQVKRYFVKGYFFDKDCCKGVTIQTFREETGLSLFKDN